MARSLDEWVMLIAKVLCALAFFVVMFVFNILWFFIFPVVLMVRSKLSSLDLYTDMNMFTPLELWGKLVRRFFGLD